MLEISLLHPMADAPGSGMILLVVSAHGDTKVFPSEWSTSPEGGHWVVTSGWAGWTKLHYGWTPIGWSPMPTLSPSVRREP